MSERDGLHPIWGGEMPMLDYALAAMARGPICRGCFEVNVPTDGDRCEMCTAEAAEPDPMAIRIVGSRREPEKTKDAQI